MKATALEPPPGADAVAPTPSVLPAPPASIPRAVAAALWRGTELGGAPAPTLPTGWLSLDAELPGSGWPTRALTEVLQPQTSVAEWRLLGHVLGALTRAGREIVVIGPPKHPHLPGLRHHGLDEHRLVWIEATAPAERLWTTEQIVKANAAGAIVAWLPQARQEQIRRLQIAAQSHEGPVFLCRPESAGHEPSAAPLRLELRTGPDWRLRVRVLKRRGAVHAGELLLRSVPGGLASILTPRLARPSALLPRPSYVPAPIPSDVLGRPASRPAGRHEHATSH